MFPDLTLFYMSIYGGFGYDWGGMCGAYLGLASGVTQAGNPPYTIADFFAIHPKWLGPEILTAAVLNGTTLVSGVPASFGFNVGNMVIGSGIQAGTVLTAVTETPIDTTGDVTAGQFVILNVASTAGMIRGNPIAGVGIGGCTVIADLTANTITLSNPATITQAGVGLMVTTTTLTLSAAATASGAATLGIYTAPPIAPAVVQLFLNLAYASLMSSRWREAWPIAMGLYISHFLTLFMQSDVVGNNTPSQIVAAGLSRGILVSKSADGVSASLQPISGLDSFGAWTTTTYGTQLATMARAVGAGAVYFR